MRREIFLAAMSAATAVLCSVRAWGQALTAVQSDPANQTVRLSPVANLGFTPIDAASIPGDNRLYIGSYSGTAPQVVVFDPVSKSVSATPFLSFADFGTQTLVAGQGMQGMTFSPDFNDPTKPGYHKFYTYTAEKSATATGSQSVMFLHPEIPNPSTSSASTAVVREWTANAAGTAIDAAIAPRIVLNFGTPAGHMGGGMKFGPDGYLYLSTGDGGGNGDGSSQTSTTDGFTGRDATGTANDVPGISNGQDFTNPTGKVLRIDPYVTNADGSPRTTPAGETVKSFNGQTKYFIPNSNPFVGDTQNVYFTPIGPLASGNTPVAPMDELYAFGFRNPWKMSFDKNAVPGDSPYVADVGSRTREEINLVQAGRNYGWPYREGDVTSATAAGTRPSPIPYLKQVSPGVYAPFDLDPTLNDPTQMAGPIARFGTRSGSGTPLIFADRPGNDIFNDGIYGWQYGDGNSVTGGFVYRGTAIPELYGKYVFGAYEYLLQDTSRTNGAMSGGGRLFYFDLAEAGDIKTIKEFNYDLAGSTIPTNGSGALMGVVQADNGDLYALLAGGSVFKINPNPGWNVDNDGSWSVGTNWSGTTPSGVNAATYFGPVITLPRTVTLDGARTAGALNFDSNVSYTLGGSPITLQVSGPAGIVAGINVSSGTHTISAPIALNSDLAVTVEPTSALFLTGTLTATGRSVGKYGMGTAQFENIRAAALNVQAGVAKIRARGTPNNSDGVSRVSSLAIGTRGQLDLTDNAMVIDYTTVGALVSDVREHLRTGRLTSSSADAQHRIGYADNATMHLTNFEGQTVGDNAVLLKFTYAGDTNLDGDVDANDLGQLALSWQHSGTWANGDLNYDGFVDISDLYLLASTWQLGVNNPLPGSSLGAALASFGLPAVVPEPGALSLLGLCGATLLARRRRA